MADQRGHPLFATLYGLLEAPVEGVVGAARRALIAKAHGRVLEVGAGTGASFPAWKEALVRSQVSEIVVVEPEPHMRRKAKARAEALGLPVELLPGRAEALPLPEASVDTVAFFLVLCSVEDLGRALAEASRVLFAGGRLLFLEHVAAKGAARAWQARLTPLWERLAAGCHLDRDTVSAIPPAGFVLEDVEERPLPFPFYRLVAGSARRRSAATCLGEGEDGAL